jgi:hypothetical protein
MTQELADTLDEATGAMTEYTRQTVVRKLAEADAFGAAKEAGISQKELTDAVLEGGAALDKIKAKLAANTTTTSFFTGQASRRATRQGRPPRSLKLSRAAGRHSRTARQPQMGQLSPLRRTCRRSPSFRGPLQTALPSWTTSRRPSRGLVRHSST